MMTRKLPTALMMFLLSMAISTSAGAQEAPPADNDAKSINEQTIYIPYDKLREVFERDGRGVFLPYEKFQKLWNEARNNQPQRTDVDAPLGALITDIESVATLGKEIVNVDAKIKVELLREGWHRVPLRLKNAAIRSAFVDGQEARIVSTKKGQYELLLTHDSDESETIELELSYAKSLTKNGGQSMVAFQSPQSPVNRWTIRTGQKDIDVQIEPMIASSKKDEEEGSAPDDEAAVDEILAFVGAAPEVKIMWTPRAEGASGLSALVAADTQARFQIAQGVARTSASVILDVSRAEISDVSLSVPADQKVVSVFDRNVKKWDVNKKGQWQTVNIELFEPVIGRQLLAVELEKFIDEIEDVSISAPQIRVQEVSRNSGIVLVNLASGLRAEPENKTGLLQIDTAELPGNLKKQKSEFAYRYASLPFDLSLNVKKIRPLINVDQLVELVIQPEQMKIELSAVYDIQLAGIFQLELTIPKEFQIREIRPLAQDGLTSVPVDTFYRDSNQEDRVIVTLGKKATGKIGLLISLDKELSDPNLLSPTDVASKIQLALPKASVEGVEFSSGNLVVYAPESLQLNATETKGLRNESFANAFSSIGSTVSISGIRPILAFSFSHTEAAIELEAKRRRPQVTVEQVVALSVQSGVVKYNARLFYDVRYSAVKSLRLDVPTALIGELRNRSNNILHQPIQPQPDDVADGFTAWELTGENEFFGKHEIRYTWEEKIADLPLGESIAIKVDRLAPANVDRAIGQVVLTKSETIDVRPNTDTTGLRPIDPQTDLANGVKIENAAMAFEFVDEWMLNLTATRFELQDLKRTSISRAVVRAVALRQNELSMQCLYQMRSVGQRISIKMPEGFDAATSFDDQPIRVNGRRVTPERGGPDQIYVPLTGQNSDEPFLLEIRYAIAGTAKQIDLPEFMDEPAVQKVYLCVYLPYERALVYQSGDWTDEAIDEHTTTIAGLLSTGNSNSVASRMFRRRNENVDDYLKWVMSGVNCDTSANQQFEVDGRPYVFSALRPEPAPAGALHLRTTNMTLLNVIVCAGMVLLGLIMLRARLTTQIAGTLLVIAALVFAGVFFPLVTEHLFSQALLLTAGVIGLVWAISDISRWIRDFRSHRRDVQSAIFSPANFATNVGDIPQSELSADSERANDSPPPAESAGGERGEQ